MPDLRKLALSCGLAWLPLSCGVVPSVGVAPALFATASGVHRFDFEHDTLHEPPQGFEPRLGRWAVADSPTALSGAQVLVGAGGDAGLLAVKEAEGVTAAAGEVAVRVFLGSSGAGLSCDATSEVAAQVLKLEPRERRIALYRKTGDSMKLVDQAPVTAPKGEWVRIGIRCESHRTVGYVDEKSVVRMGEGLGSFDLALVADAGVIAQFDDLAYWASK
ncbi:MAG: hypothetical protein ABW298_09535 [Candidatus Binatia bacterium]